MLYSLFKINTIKDSGPIDRINRYVAAVSHSFVQHMAASRSDICACVCSVFASLWSFLDEYLCDSYME